MMGLQRACAHGPVLGGARDAELLGLVLDDVDVADQIERVAHLGRGGQRLEEMAARVRQARGTRAPAGRRDLVVAGVHVDDERPHRAAEYLGGRVAAAAGTEAIDDDGRGLVAQESPHEGAFLGAQHLDRGLVGAHDGRRAHEGQHARDQRLEQFGRAMKEVGHGAARDGDAEPPEALLEPVDRDRVAALGDDEGDEARTVLHAITDALGPVSRDDVLAARAGQGLAHVNPSPKVAGHVLPLDGGLALANVLELVAAALGALALTVGDLVVDALGDDAGGAELGVGEPRFLRGGWIGADLLADLVADGLDLLALWAEEAAFEGSQFLSRLLELAVHGLDLGLNGVA
jgi:hypothetical protein